MPNLAAVPSWDVLFGDPSLFNALPPEVQDAIYEQIAVLEVKLRIARESRRIAPRAAPSGSDSLLSAEQAAEIAGVKPSWLTRHGHKLPFTKKLSHKTVRYSENGLRKWLATRRA